MKSEILIRLFISLSFLMFSGCAKTHSYYIDNASLGGSMNNDIGSTINKETGHLSKQEKLGLLIGGHYIDKGNNFVVLIRKWGPGEILAIDDEWYEKLTIEIRKPKYDELISANSENVALHFSEGGSAWLYKGVGAYSTEATGR